ncbi:MAG: hypothetical protein KDB27_13420 [Planctomycetales bacterium]|nr:hypothetical protein [Planctomycetales bacterium]
MKLNRDDVLADQVQAVLHHQLEDEVRAVQKTQDRQVDPVPGAQASIGFQVRIGFQVKAAQIAIALVLDKVAQADQNFADSMVGQMPTRGVVQVGARLKPATENA